MVVRVWCVMRNTSGSLSENVAKNKNNCISCSLPIRRSTADHETKVHTNYWLIKKPWLLITLQGVDFTNSYDWSLLCINLSVMSQYKSQVIMTTQLKMDLLSLIYHPLKTIMLIRRQLLLYPEFIFQNIISTFPGNIEQHLCLIDFCQEIVCMFFMMICFPFIKL